MTAATVPVSVVIPTIGRIEQLTACMHSLALCRPGPAETILVVQGPVDGVTALAGRFSAIHPRVVVCAGTGIGRAANVGFREASNDVVVMTHDDCSVAEDWIARAWHHARAFPEGIICGRVLPDGDPELVASTITRTDRFDHTAGTSIGAIYPNNMVAPRSWLLAAGGFDERIVPAAEDNDLCYRWLRAGRTLLYEPDMVVWHRDWRTPAQMRALHAGYGYGQGLFYAKHLRRRDVHIASRVLREALGGGRLLVQTSKPFHDPRAAFYPGLLAGLRAGRSVFAPEVGPPAAATAGRRASALHRVGRRVKARLVTRPLARRVRRWLTRPPAEERRLTPVSRVFGWDRGLPIDRHYIEVFMERHSADIRGRVLEVGDDRYAGKHGEELERFDILDVDEANRRATLIADLSTGEGLPSSAFDCIILTQVLLLVYDLGAAIRLIHDALDEGGVVLATLPGFSKGCPDEEDYWRFTVASARRLFGEAFGDENVELDVHGNFASTVAFLDGRAVDELTDREITKRDPDFPLLIGVRAVRRG